MKMVVFLSVLTGFITNANSEDFAPSKLTLSAPDVLVYNEYEKGYDLEIPVVVGGTPATVIFLVFTKDFGPTITIIRNGYLGWHQVNKIDTCVYVSEPYQFNAGNKTIEWDGSYQDGTKINNDTEFNYYLFGYDHKSAKVPATRHMPYTWDDTNIIITHDGTGSPLANPVIYSGVNEWKEQQGAWERTRTKWIIGNDPENISLAETTLYSGWNEHCQFIPDPQDANLFLINTIDNNSIAHMRKYTWVPNDEAELVHEFGEEGEFLWGLDSLPGEWSAHQPLRYIGDDFIVTTATDYKGVSETAELIVVEVEDGDELLRIDLSEWWISESDRDAGGQRSGGPTDMDVMHGKLILGSHTSCLNQMIDPFDFEDKNWNLWVNGNGDFVGDKNFGEDSERPWVCNDYEQIPYKYSISLDDKLFSIFPADGLGNNSFGLYAPDGTGIGYFSFANETAGYKFGQRIVDSGTAYDGIYCDNASLDEQAGGIWYIAHDSISGVIVVQTNSVEDDDSLSRFQISGNYPNPFNPETTISFSLPESGTVTVEIYNTAGQMVDTAIDGYMDAGSHSVVWNAGSLSAGIYFCTVRSGQYSGTIKMTVIR